MKLYGSLTNRIMETAKNPVPEVGMGATELMWSDRHAYTVVKVINPKLIEVARDKATIINGDEVRAGKNSPTYAYETDPDAYTLRLSLRKNGAWVRVGGSMNGTSFLLGHREEYRDPHF